MAPTVLGPCTKCDIAYSSICNVLDELCAKRHLSVQGMPKLAIASPSMFTLNFGVGASHDAALETACVIIPRGGVHLDAALGLLRAFMYWWGGIRVQGYVSFLPQEIECQSSCLYPPDVRRSWGMPMVVVDGASGQLKVQAVERVAAPGEEATLAD